MLRDVSLYWFLTEFGYISLDSLRFRYIADSALDYVAIMQHAYMICIAALFRQGAMDDRLARLLGKRFVVSNVILPLRPVCAHGTTGKGKTSIKPFSSPVMIAYLAVSFLCP